MSAISFHAIRLLGKIELNKKVHINVHGIVLKNSLLASNPSLCKGKFIFHLHKHYFIRNPIPHDKSHQIPFNCRYSAFFS
jgi:hypothetical protein